MINDPAPRDRDRFVAMFVRAAHDAARAGGYRPPSDQAVSAMLERVPAATRAEIGAAVEAGLIVPAEPGHTFRLTSVAARKGPYRWFSENRASGLPGPNWEYFFQVAEFARLSRVLASRYEVGFEDGLMDVSVRDRGSLLWYIEVKAGAEMLEPLLAALRQHGRRVDLQAPDRGNDPLRKAKYLVRLRPRYLTLVGGQAQRHFDVAVTDDTFMLDERTSSPEGELLR